MDDNEIALKMTEGLRPVEDRLARVEAREEYRDREIGEIKQSVKHLEEKLSDFFDKIQTVITNQRKSDAETVDDLRNAVQKNQTSITSLKYWILGAVGTITALIPLIIHFLPKG